MNAVPRKANRITLTRDFFTEDLKCLNETPRKLPRETKGTEALFYPSTPSLQTDGTGSTSRLRRVER